MQHKDQLYVCYKKMTLIMGLLTYIHQTHETYRHIDTSPYPKTPAPIPGYRLTGCRTKYTEGQLSFFRQLLMTKVTTAHWTCESITPTQLKPSSNLKKH